jgi:hypothetical protein
VRREAQHQAAFEATMAAGRELHEAGKAADDAVVAELLMENRLGSQPDEEGRRRRRKKAALLRRGGGKEKKKAVLRRGGGGKEKQKLYYDERGGREGEKKLYDDENKGDINKKVRLNYHAGTDQQKATKKLKDFERNQEKREAKHKLNKPLEEYAPKIFETKEVSSQQRKKQRKEAAAKKQREKKPTTTPPPPPPAAEMPGGRLARAAEERGRAPPAMYNE